jgi:hypothetical protein
MIKNLLGRKKENLEQHVVMYVNETLSFFMSVLLWQHITMWVWEWACISKCIWPMWEYMCMWLSVCVCVCLWVTVWFCSCSFGQVNMWGIPHCQKSPYLSLFTYVSKTKHYTELWIRPHVRNGLDMMAVKAVCLLWHPYTEDQDNSGGEYQICGRMILGEFLNWSLHIPWIKFSSLSKFC